MLSTDCHPQQKAKPTGNSNGDLRAARIPRNELLDLLFSHFDTADYWTIKALTEHVRQPQVYLKEVLGGIAQIVPRGPYMGMWSLKDEFKGRRAGKVEEEVVKEEEGKGKGKVEEDDEDEEDDDDDEMEIVS